MPKVDFYYDIGCPYAYLASTQIEAICAAANATLEWKPILLGGLYRSIGGKDHPADHWPSSKVLHNHTDMARQAEAYGVELKRPDCYPQRTVSAQRLLLCAGDDVRAPLTHRLYRAYWVEGLAISNREVLGRIAQEFGMDLQCIDTPDAKEALFQATAEAESLGHFGVPSFQVGERFYWGADRLHFVAQSLGLEPMDAPEETPLEPPPTLEFFHDFASPFSYLASTQIERIAKAHGAQLTYKPILLGALFKSIGTPMVPLFEMTAARQRYLRQDLGDWAKWWGVDFNFPQTFPLRTVTPLRVALQEPRCTSAIYKAAWVDNHNIGETEILERVLDEAGFNGQALITGTQDSEIKSQLFANTQNAVERNVCGVPSLIVNQDILFWGQDRLSMVEGALAGWVPKV